MAKRPVPLYDFKAFGAAIKAARNEYGESRKKVSDTKAYIRELQAVSRNINQIAKRANATGTVYRQDIEDIKKAVDEIWRLQRRTLLNQP